MVRVRIEHLSQWCGRAFLAASVAIISPSMVRAQDAMPVTVVRAERSEISESIPVVGRLAAREEIAVHPLVFGRQVTDVLVDAGDVVAKGQALAILDTAEARILLDKNAVSSIRAQAAVLVEDRKVEVARVVEREALKRVQRSRALHAKQALAEQVLDDHENAYARAVAELELARQALALGQADEKLIERERQEIELAIERSTVRAPRAGRILSRDARIGSTTSEASPPFFVLGENDTIEMLAEVTQNNFVGLREGMVARITIPGESRTIGGTIRLKAARLDTATGSALVRIQLADTADLAPGMFIRAAIETSARNSVLVPVSAVRNTGTGPVVYVVKDDTVAMRTVSTGPRQDDRIEIRDGLSAGELVVLKAGGFFKGREHVQPLVADISGDLPQDVSATVVLQDPAEAVR
ncbi:efflux RND transporter periplasmic adaptor subunit [Pararhizobium arenae]|uniref:efflux RND transporter periplasmic adaptor subunit n=1 Tax=Pararhizobium arenae TaxID=1856850 RepID=UPI000A45FBC6|nr:efflux RND transporter periplasmic adaptor subunit [Pararhizobium arenae]